MSIFKQLKKLEAGISLPVICLLLLSGCLTSGKVDKQVAKFYNKNQSQNAVSNEHISISSGLLQADDKISATETKTSHMLPLIIYWQWDYKNTCTLNPKVPINNFAATVLNTDNKQLDEKIGNQKLILTVDKVPNKFAIDDKAHVLILLYAIGWDNVSIKGENTDMVVSYKLMQGSTETKKGTITIPYTPDKKKLGMFKSWKTATKEYLDQYNANITSMSRQAMEKITNEL